MTYSLKIWQKPDSDEFRLYINGTTRRAIYFKLSAAGHVVWSSKVNDTPAKYQSGDHYGKLRKDGAAASEVARAFGLTLGNGSTAADWERIVGIARDGIAVQPAEDDADEGGE